MKGLKKPVEEDFEDIIEVLLVGKENGTEREKNESRKEGRTQQHAHKDEEPTTWYEGR